MNPTQEMNDSDQQLVQNLWEKTGGEDLLQGHESLQVLFDSIPDAAKTVETDPNLPTILVCIDDRIPGNADLEAANYVHLAGEGILDPDAVTELNGKIQAIRPHTGCGAKALYCEQQEIQTDDADSVGMTKVEELSKQLTQPNGDPVEVLPPLTKDKLEAIHIARVLYYDGTGRFDFSKVAGLPAGFIISRQLISDPAYAEIEAGVGIGIAQGHHGFGHLFSDQTPFYLVAVTDDQPGSLPIEQLNQELSAIAAKASAVKIDQIIIHHA